MVIFFNEDAKILSVICSKDREGKTIILNDLDWQAMELDRKESASIPKRLDTISLPELRLQSMVCYLEKLCLLIFYLMDFR